MAARWASVSDELKTATIGGVRVLTNGSGLTLYWFAFDTPTRSACYGTCAAQVTYDGHPLCTYVLDAVPGQASGNNVTLNGGLWHEVIVRGWPGPSDAVRRVIRQFLSDRVLLEPRRWRRTGE